MGIKDLFKRKNDTVIDLSHLQKRGIIKQKEAIENTSSVVDLTDNKDEGSALGFLGNLATSSESSTEIAETPTSFASERKSKLKGILRDMKLEMKNTTDKIYKISDRLDLIERKLERLERRAGYDSN